MRDARRLARHPDTVLLLGLLVFTATTTTLTGNLSPAVAKVAPLWLGLLWSGTFAIAGFLALLGAMWRDPLVGWLLELVGRIGLAVTGLGFSLALIAGASDAGAAVAIGFVVGITISSGVRAWQVYKRLEEFRGALSRQR